MKYQVTLTVQHEIEADDEIEALTEARSRPTAEGSIVNVQVHATH